MASPANNPAQGQVVPAQPAQAATAPAVAATIQQFTAISAHVPPQVWTEDALKDFHAKQKEVIFDNNRVFENQQKRQNRQGWAGIIIVAGIVGFGLYLTAVGNAFGKDIVGATIFFLAGYLAGQGKATLK
jgi:hypothetical protein